MDRMLNELKKILWKLHHRRDFIISQTERSTMYDYMDKPFWLGEKIANDRSISIVEKSIRKVECVS